MRDDSFTTKTELPTGSEDAINAAIYAQARELPLDAARAQLRDIHDQLRAAGAAQRRRPPQALARLPAG